MKASYTDLLLAIDDFDIEEFLLERKFRPLKTKGDEWIGLCPKCGKEKLAVDITKRAFHCWIDQKFEDYWDTREHCFKRRPLEGAGGVIALVKWLDDLDTKDAITYIMEHSVFGNGISELPNIRGIETIADTMNFPSIYPPEFWKPITEVLPYMSKRNITLEDVRDFGIFYCDKGKYSNRIVFPVWEDNRLIYWQARAMYEADQVQFGHKFIKALNPERMEGCAVSSEVLMNLDVACKFERVAIVEGPMDCVRTGSASVCTFTKSITPAQVRRLLLKGVKAIDLMWDGPSAKEPQGAWHEMVHVAPWLSTFFDLRLIFLPSGDPADYTRSQLDEFRYLGLPSNNVSRLMSL